MVAYLALFDSVIRPEIGPSKSLGCGIGDAPLLLCGKGGIAIRRCAHLKLIMSQLQLVIHLRPLWNSCSSLV